MDIFNIFDWIKNISDFFSSIGKTLNNIINFIGEIPSLLQGVLFFIPKEYVNTIIGVMIICIIIGLIRWIRGG